MSSLTEFRHWANDHPKRRVFALRFNFGRPGR